MNLENTEDFLRKFDYPYERHDNQLIIDMGFSQKLLIDFSNPKNIAMEEKLKGLNFLTGIIDMSIKNAILLNLIGGLILSLIIAFYDTKGGIFFFLGLMFWVLVWFSFYRTKAENLKQLLVKWHL